MSLEELRARHAKRRKRRAHELWYPNNDGGEPDHSEVIELGGSHVETGLVPVHKTDGTTVYMTPEAISRLERIPVKDLMSPRPDILGEAEQRELRMTTGGDFESWSDAKAYMKANNLRFVEQGDFQDKQRRALREWAQEPEDRRGPRPGPSRHERSLFKVKSPSMRKLFKEMWG